MDFAFGTSTRGNGSRERLAWAVLLICFTIWVALVLAVPWVVNSFLKNATRPLHLIVQANEGTVGLAGEQGQRDAIFVGEPARDVEGRASILTNTTDSGLVTVQTPDEGQIVSRLHVYGNTNLDILKATAPRFGLSSNTLELELTLQNGRLRINVPEREGRPVSVRISTPQDGEVYLENAGQYALLANNTATDVIVLEGRARVRAGGNELALKETQRATVPVEGELSGPFSSERDLVQNGGFENGMAGWTHVRGDVERSGQSAVEVGVSEVEGEPVLRFHRVGVGHADASVRQVVNQDVTDVNSLELFLTLRIVGQSLGVCGVQGSECPLFVNVTYDDVYGNEQVWRQGYYAVGEIVSGSTPEVCQFCAGPHNPHLQVPLNQVHSFQSGNFLEKLAQQNIAPRFVKSVSFVGSGHSFESHVVDFSLIADE